MTEELKYENFAIGNIRIYLLLFQKIIENPFSKALTRYKHERLKSDLSKNGLLFCVICTKNFLFFFQNIIYFGFSLELIFQVWYSYYNSYIYLGISCCIKEIRYLCGSGSSRRKMKT